MEKNNKHKVLVIVSHDLGEFGYAYDFSHKLENLFDVYYLLPNHIFKINHKIKSLKCLEYTSDKDIQNSYKSINPKFVLFFSAFLLVPNKIFSIKSLSNFIALLFRDNKVII